VAAGDPIQVLDRPDHDVTFATMFRALVTQPELLPRLVAVDGLKDWVRERVLAAQRA
jgi:MOSC domain-containing protein YiiM